MAPKKEVKKKASAKPKLPESRIKLRKLMAERAAKRVKRAADLKKKKAELRKEVFRRAQRYYVKNERVKKSKLSLVKNAKKNGNVYVDEEPKVVFVMRIRGVNGVHPRPRKILQLLRLRQINNGVFVKVNKATLNMLRICEPYVCWGFPSLKTIRSLVYKRGFVKVNSQRTAINNNEIVRKTLGKHDVICVEDLIHQIHTCGKKFKQVNNFLWPFKLSNPKGGWRKKNNHFVEGGDYGNREKFINGLVEKML